MKIALIGYGKMGKAIEEAALERGHEISLKVTSANADFQKDDLIGTDTAIEFSKPESAVKNIYKCFDYNIPVIVGTTGWYNRFDEVREKLKAFDRALFYATNFSIGVNIFFEVNKKLAEMMNGHKNYAPSMEEIHHTEKLDAPSGTAITLANDILAKLDRKSSWINEANAGKEELPIVSKREKDVKGTHTVKYDSEIDTITIQHAAKSRKGFAMGAVLAAEWMQGKTGIYTMKDLLNI